VFFSFVVKQYELGADVGASNAGLDRGSCIDNPLHELVVNRSC
jgi:hypothetical protein